MWPVPQRNDTTETDVGETFQPSFQRIVYRRWHDGMEACKKWLRKEGIKGEHIFVSDDDWNRLRGIFNFSGIPFGVLIGKDGKVIKTKHVMTDDDPLLKKALSANVAQ